MWDTNAEMLTQHSSAGAVHRVFPQMVEAHDQWCQHGTQVDPNGPHWSQLGTVGFESGHGTTGRCQLHDHSTTHYVIQRRVVHQNVHKQSSCMQINVIHIIEVLNQSFRFGPIGTWQNDWIGRTRIRSKRFKNGFGRQKTVPFSLCICTVPSFPVKCIDWFVLVPK